MPDPTLLGSTTAAEATNTVTTSDPTNTSTAAATTATTTATTPAVATTTATASKGYLTDDGRFQDGWLDRLGDDFKPAHQTLAKYRDLPSLAKSHFELQQLLGRKASAVVIPGEKSSAEEIAAFRKAIGAPDKAEDYKLRPEKLPPGIEWDDELGKGFAEIAAKHHLPAAAMRELTDRYLAGETARGEAVREMMAAELQQGTNTLKTAWGGNYDKNIQLAIRGAQTVGLDPNSPGLRDPEVVKALTRFASMMSEDKLVSGDFSPTLQVGKSRANDIMTNPTNALYQKYQDGDRDTVELVRGLLRNG